MSLIAIRARLGDHPRDGESDLDQAIGVVTEGRSGAPGGTLAGGGGDDLLFGSDADDRLAGGRGEDVLYGFGGDDRLAGGRGDDLLAGGSGSNTLSGGAGLDTASWADLPVRDRPRGSEGVALNLLDTPFRFGFGAVDFLVAPGTASHLDRGGFGVDEIRDIERFDGSAGRSDVARLAAGFVQGETDADGFTAYADGMTTLFLRGFEGVFIG